MTALILVAVAAYLLGSVSFAVVVSHRMRLPDPRTFGSKNPGATNMLRGSSRLAAAMVLLGDALKGWLAVWLTSNVALPMGAPVECIMVAALAVFLGHAYPIFFGFKGGKGVATALGVLLALSPALGVCVAIVWLLVMAITRISSLSALISSVAAPLLAWVFLESLQLKLTVLIMALILLAHHHSNIRKLLEGQETVFRKRD